MSTPTVDPYPPPGADVPGAPPPLHRDQRNQGRTAHPSGTPTTTAPEARRAVRSTMYVAALAAAAAAVALAVVARRRRRHRPPRRTTAPTQ